MKDYSWAEQAFLSAARYVPGVGKLSTSTRVLEVVRGSTWTLAGYGGSQLLRLAAMLVLARYLLDPIAFGLLALVNVFLTALNMLSDLGIGTSVIQHRRADEPGFINTAFLIQAGRGVVLWALAAALAYPFALFYEQPGLGALSLVATISILASGFASASVWQLTRQVRLRELTLLRVGAEAAGFVAAILWAVVSPTAWALVVGRIATELSFMVGTHLISELPPSLRWDRAAAKDILVFGGGLFASSATYFLVGEAERLVIGKFVSIAVLGCFSLALSITAAATGGLHRLLAQVFYPVISSSVRADRDKAASHFKKTRPILLIVSSSMAIAFIGGGNWIVAALLGPNYVMAGWMLRLLGFRAALELFSSGTTHMLFALGTSKYAAVGNTAKLVFLGVGLTVAFGKFGFPEALWVLAISPVVAHIPLLIGIKKHLRSVLWMEVWTVAVFLLSSGLTALLLRVASEQL